MECERLQRLVKQWYTQVQDEAMAPARMVMFMEQHIDECHDCLADPLVRGEIAKITEIILPPEKKRKPANKEQAAKAPADAAPDAPPEKPVTTEQSPAEESEEATEEKYVSDDDEDGDEASNIEVDDDTVGEV